MASLRIEAPKRLRDLIWTPAMLRTSEDFRGQELGEILLPALTPLSLRKRRRRIAPGPRHRLGGTAGWRLHSGGTEDAAGGWRTGAAALDPGTGDPAGGESRSLTGMPLNRRGAAAAYSRRKSVRRRTFVTSPSTTKSKKRAAKKTKVPQGDWARERKVADWPAVIKLTTDASTKQSKDLQLAAWLTEAVLRKEGFAGLRSGLELIKGLLENFWDTLYPEIEDGDLELRSAPLSWLGLKLDMAVKSVPLVRGGLRPLQVRGSPVGGLRSGCHRRQKIEARKKKIEEKAKLSGEEWEKAFTETPKPVLKQTVADLNASLALVAETRQDRRQVREMPRPATTR